SRFDLASEHAIDNHCSLEQVAAVLGEDGALRRFADRMTGAADPLDAAGDAGRRLNLDDKVDGTHVDTQLEARGRYQSGKATGLDDRDLAVGAAEEARGFRQRALCRREPDALRLGLRNR